MSRTFRITISCAIYLISRTYSFAIMFVIYFTNLQQLFAILVIELFWSSTNYDTIHAWILENVSPFTTL